VVSKVSLAGGKPALARTCRWPARGIQRQAAPITGGSGGIGLHIAEQFAERQAHVLINGRSAGAATQAVAKLREISQNVRFVAGDCASYQDAAAASTPPGHWPEARHPDQRGAEGETGPTSHSPR
jgi:3-oxoacyl-[acyl-carrier protein] reductase